MSAEETRLARAANPKTPWRLWGPYLSERQWGTVREDYSSDGNAWDSFPHDHARSRAYKWGEDGLAGYSDDQQQLCWALALWNGRDPIIKERLFGLTNGEGNHGEDVKEYYFYLDSTPTHSWMRWLYKYPQRAYPYSEIVEKNRARGRHEPEYELLDTGVFDDNRYFDVVVDFAKASPTDTCIRITVHNRGPEPASLHLLPHLWFRNDWWMNPAGPRPSLRMARGSSSSVCIAADHPRLGAMYLHCEGAPELLFTENETNSQRLWGQPNATRFVKDAFNDRLVHGRRDTVNPEGVGTKSAAHFIVEIPAGQSKVIRLRLNDEAPGSSSRPFSDFEATMRAREKEADEFYETVIPEGFSKDRANVMRQAIAGMLWGKQYYYFDLDRWLDEHGANPVSGGRRSVRNREWFHMLNQHVISMPDKWEYPWYAAWDLAFHVLPIQLVDPEFAKEQLLLMLDENYMHPGGQMPAYEWNFGDVNPPVHAWASFFLYMRQKNLGKPDRAFLETTIARLTQNFNWWVNRKDPEGRSLFSGGFLGLDNIGVFDRSAPLPTGGYLLQADGTAWMAFYSHCMIQIALELSEEEPSTYGRVVSKFVEHFFWIAGAMHRKGDQVDDLWDEDDGFFYDVLVTPDGRAQRLKLRSMVGLLPLMASTVFPESSLRDLPKAVERIRSFQQRYPELHENIHPFEKPGVAGRHLLSVLNETKLRRILSRMLDEREFLSPYGIRSLSKAHESQPYVFTSHGTEFRVEYQPAESLTGAFGGNSNWRGPIWLPVNVLLIRGLINLYGYFGDDFKVECPTGSGQHMTLFEIAREISHRLESIFLTGPNGRRPVNDSLQKFSDDPHWRDLVLFYEYFHGDTGQGLGASHQTGWTGVIAFLADFFERITPESMRTEGRASLGRLNSGSRRSGSAKKSAVR
ncbi:MAG: glucosidase [Phycisphaeraceae bacterium]|nr:glucosidase [Phycisphaeraceae bacterium]